MRYGSGGLIAAGVQQESWTVGGVAYRVPVSTNLDDRVAPFAEGAWVTVNSFVDKEGIRTATQIRSVTIHSQLYLPVVTR